MVVFHEGENNKGRKRWSGGSRSLFIVSRSVTQTDLVGTWDALSDIFSAMPMASTALAVPSTNAARSMG